MFPQTLWSLGRVYLQCSIGVSFMEVKTCCETNIDNDLFNCLEPNGFSQIKQSFILWNYEAHTQIVLNYKMHE